MKCKHKRTITRPARPLPLGEVTKLPLDSPEILYEICLDCGEKLRTLPMKRTLGEPLRN